MKKILTLTCAFLMLLCFLPNARAAGAPSQKQEAVYGILDADGRVESVYIVNRLHGGSITDYGRYTAVENLTTPEALTQNGDEITLQTEAEVLYYQGTAETKELPWSISLDYILNGTEVTASQLAGSSGTLQIHITVKQNAAVQETFFLNYALQVGVLLDTDLCTNIETTDATIAQAGGDQQLSHTILPGTEADILITADVRDFEMDAVTFNGIRMSMNLDLDHSAFSQQLTDLSDAIAQLDDGAGELRDGAVRLSEGLTDYVSGLKAFAAGLSELYSGVSDLNAGASELSEGLSALCSQSDLLVSGALQIQQSAFDAVNQQLSESGMGLPVLTPDNYKAVLENIPELSEVLTKLDGTVSFTQGLLGYTGGVAQLSAGASELAGGTSQLKASVSTLVSSAYSLYDAGLELNAAVAQLRDGLISYKEGTAELKDGTADMDTKINEQIDALLKGISGSGDPVISFASEKNTGISAVQFMLKTAPIQIPESEATVTPKPAPLNFWQKLLKLFGISV